MLTRVNTQLQKKINEKEKKKKKKERQFLLGETKFLISLSLPKEMCNTITLKIQIKLPQYKRRELIC